MYGNILSYLVFLLFFYFPSKAEPTLGVRVAIMYGALTPDIVAHELAMPTRTPAKDGAMSK